MVNRVLAVHDDSGKIIEMDSGLAKLAGRDANDVEEFKECDIDLMGIDKCTPRRFLQIGRFGLRNQNFLYLHCLSYCLAISLL